jgi:hypothetical protein
MMIGMAVMTDYRLEIESLLEDIVFLAANIDRPEDRYAMLSCLQSAIVHLQLQVRAEMSHCSDQSSSAGSTR